MNWLEYENEALAQGYTHVCGVDEAGRGPLAGPVCAAAVILPTDKCIEGVNDSKKLSEKKREALFEVIKAEAVSYSIAFATVEEIDCPIYRFRRDLSSRATRNPCPSPARLFWRRCQGTGFCTSTRRNTRSISLISIRATAPRRMWRRSRNTVRARIIV